MMTLSRSLNTRNASLRPLGGGLAGEGRRVSFIFTSLLAIRTLLLCERA